MRYLAQREHSRHELEHKLRRHLSNVSRAKAAGRRQSQAASGTAVRRAGQDIAAGDVEPSDADLSDSDLGEPDLGDSELGDPDSIDAEFSEVETSGRISAALDALAFSGLLSDERTAASVLRSQGQRYGVLRLKHTLQAKGLSADLVADTVESARETELHRAQAVWAKRFGATAQSPEDRVRQMRFLAQRGFDADTVARVMRIACGRLHADDDAASDGLPEDQDPAGPAKKHSGAADSEPNTPL